MSGLLAFLFETAKTMVGEATITAFVAKLKDGQTRKKVLENLRLQLGVLGIKGEQADYIVGEFSRSDALQRIGQLNTLAEIQNEVAYCLNLPAQFHVGDPRAEESELVTAALYLALLAVNRPGQYQRLVDEPKVREKILEHLPTIGEAVQEKQERRKAPLKMAANDISQVLVRARQHQAKIVTGADGKWEINGPLNLQFSAQGENAKRLQEWLQEVGWPQKLDGFE